MARSVTIAAGLTQVVLPDGGSYDGGETVTLNDEQFAAIPADNFPGTVIDNGFVAEPGDEVVDAVAAPALTSTVAAGATPTKAEFDALRADVVALRTALTGPGRALT